MEIQHHIGADIIMSFDECPPYPATREYVEKSLRMTLEWVESMSKCTKDPQNQALFGIVQGGVYEDLRAKSAESLMAMISSAILLAA